MNNLTIFLSIFAIACTFLFSAIPDSESKLWDYVVDVKFLENPISQGNNSILVGTVVDHAYRPVSQADVKVTFAGESYMLKTDSDGEFGKQLDVSELKPRTYSVQIFVSTDDGKKSMARTTLHIDGHTEKSAKYERQIESMELANDPSKLRKNSNDPISEILFQHYLELQEKATHAQYEEELLNESKNEIKLIRQIVYEKLLEELEKRPLVYTQIGDTPKMLSFLGNLDPERKEIFNLQLNTTKLRVMHAQIAMQTVLNNGGSLEDARQAYFDHAAITHEELNSLIFSPETNIKLSESVSLSDSISTKN